LALAEEMSWERWTLRLRDDLMISPEAAFGGLDTGGALVRAGSASSLGSADAILTQRAKRVNNSAAGEINYYLSRRSVLTVAGAYNVLRFSQAGFIDNDSTTGRVGYDYVLSRKDNIGVLYTYRRFVYSGNNPLLQTDTVQLAYGRRVTGRLAFQVAAGPQLSRSAGAQRIVNWNLTSAATFQTRRTQYLFSYTRETAAGSGVFSGTHSDNVTLGVRQAVTQSWSASLNAGYAFNEALTPVPGVANSFGNWYGNASLGRPIGRQFRFFVNYGYQQQNGASGICPVAACGGVTPSRHIAAATVEWHPFAIAAR
jgi:hypothetical protein